jgi:hypothetical protein
MEYAGITLSPKQVQRGTELAKERKLNNVEFKVPESHLNQGKSCIEHASDLCSSQTCFRPV